MPAKRVLVRVSSKKQVEAALRLGFHEFLAPAGFRASVVASFLTREADALFQGGRRVGTYAVIDSPRAERALRTKKGLLVVETRDWDVIPLENLIAARDGRGGLFAVARDAKEVRLFLSTLERGVDGVVVDGRDIALLRTLRGLASPEERRVELVQARVAKIEPLGVGERVCVDTTSLLRPDEGLLVGDRAKGFLLVASEAQPGRYVAARPFRVNAGAIHSYVWNGDATNYLSEITSGASVTIIDAKGRTRRCDVGRAKIESRPLVRIHARWRGGAASVVLQNAETVRLLQPGARTKSVADIQVGDPVLAHRDAPARHAGMRVRESVREL